MFTTQKYALILYYLIINYLIESVFCISKPMDLTWSFENNTIYWSGVQNFVFTKKLATTTEKGFW